MQATDPLLTGLISNQPDLDQQRLAIFSLTGLAPIGLDPAGHRTPPSQAEISVTAHTTLPAHASPDQRRTALFTLIQQVLVQQASRLMRSGMANALTTGHWEAAAMAVLAAQAHLARPQPALAALLATPPTSGASAPLRSCATFSGHAGFGCFENRLHIRLGPDRPQQLQLTIQARLALLDQPGPALTPASPLSSTHPVQHTLHWAHDDKP
ncbi:hypothetical protein HNQ59_002053 [Chitinivorax tropicus]|uniref:Uncharacterized protein n=1 Tax=Chitinivorax tropicus TaxID=714531 RepID=A0A840MK34_9PROT|nr:hypothetical protein [Chitinivorax tropicus]MBB5018760.1 hypothetical protein [Chitinivorax tropicus]